MKLEYSPYTLDFKFDAGTSRGVMRKRKIWIIKITNLETGLVGEGEVAPLWGLSKETEQEVENQLKVLSKEVPEKEIPQSQAECYGKAKELSGGIASITMGLEMAFIDLMGGGRHFWFKSEFSKGNTGMKINGLIWMGNSEAMKKQVDQKLEEDFECIKLKIGALDFEKELAVLEYIRELAPKIEMRVDANGAFAIDEAADKFESLSKFSLHSIEQPIATGNWNEMRKLCEVSPVKIALDEELIGVNDRPEKIRLLENIKPDYLVLKPSLLGGFESTGEWIELAKERKIGWWITSALESNLGLAAIAQFTSQFKLSEFQGLGTGGLFYNNLEAETFISKGHLYHKQV